MDKYVIALICLEQAAVVVSFTYTPGQKNPLSACTSHLTHTSPK